MKSRDMSSLLSAPLINSIILECTTYFNCGISVNDCVAQLRCSRTLNLNGLRFLYGQPKRMHAFALFCSGGPTPDGFKPGFLFPSELRSPSSSSPLPASGTFLFPKEFEDGMVTASCVELVLGVSDDGESHGGEIASMWKSCQLVVSSEPKMANTSLKQVWTLCHMSPRLEISSVVTEKAFERMWSHISSTSLSRSRHGGLVDEGFSLNSCLIRLFVKLDVEVSLSALKRSPFSIWACT